MAAGLCLTLGLALMATSCSPPAPSAFEQGSLEKVEQGQAYGHIPLVFEANRGQSNIEVRFLSRGNGFSAFLTPAKVVVALRNVRNAGEIGSETGLDILSATVGMQFVGANESPTMTGLDELAGRTNYFASSDPAGWQLGIPNYSKVRYSEVYPNVDLVLYGNQRCLVYDFVISPGGDPADIRLRFDGVDSPHLDQDGNLVLGVGSGVVVHRAPLAYQMADGDRQVVASQYALHAVAGDSASETEFQVGFEVGPYDRSRDLIVDPEVSYSSYLGGYRTDWSSDIAVDSEGYAYVTGYTSSPRTFTESGYARELAGDIDIFVAKFNRAGSQLVYSTYLGGSRNDSGLGIAVDDDGNAYITGSTQSKDFPVTEGAFRRKYPTGQSNSFVTKLSPQGDALVYSTYLGGRSGESVAVDKERNAYVTGRTVASELPTTEGSFQPDLMNHLDAFVAKLNREGSALVYSTHLGGSDADIGTAISVDADGNAYVTGYTESSDFPTTAGALETGYNGGIDAFVTKLNAAGSNLAYSTFLGGDNSDRGMDIAVDIEGNAYVTGETSSDNFPTLDSLQHQFGGGGYDAFVTRLGTTGRLGYSTYLGAEEFDAGNAIAVDQFGNAWVTGETFSPGMKTKDPFQAKLGGSSDAFAAKIKAGGRQLLYYTYLGGSAKDVGTGIAVDASGSAYITGVSHSEDFPIADGAQAELKGDGDAFITKVSFSAGLSIEQRPIVRNDGPYGTQNLTYTFIVTNKGPDKATNLLLVDSLPEGATLVSAEPTKGRWTDSPQGSCAEDSGVVTCRLGSLAVGVSARVRITVAPTVSGTLENYASVSSGETDSDVTDNTTVARTDVLVVPTPTPVVTPTPTATTTPGPTATTTPEITPAPEPTATTTLSATPVAAPTPTPTPNTVDTAGGSASEEPSASTDSDSASKLASIAEEGPDLLVSISAPPVTTAGENMGPEVVTKVENVGTVAVFGYQIDTVLSTDEIVPTGFARLSELSFEEDALLGGGRTISRVEIPPGESVSLESVILRIPADTPAGRYFLCAVVDPSNRRSELDEGNNTSCAALTIDAPNPKKDAAPSSEPSLDAPAEAPRALNRAATSAGACGLPSAGGAPLDLGLALMGLVGPGLLLRRRRGLPSMYLRSWNQAIGRLLLGSGRPPYTP